MKKSIFFRTERGAVITLAVLIAFVCAAISLAMIRIREDLRLATAFDETRKGEHEAWVSLERFFKDNLHCTQMLKGRRLGDTILGGDGPESPQVGKEWKESGWVIKDLYLLRQEDEAAWELSRVSDKQVYIKASLVPRPKSGIKMGVEYMLNAPTSVRLIPIQVLQAHEKIFAHCERQEAEEACYQSAMKQGVLPQIQFDRAPASVGKQCVRGVVHRAHCLMPTETAPIWSCNH